MKWATFVARCSFGACVALLAAGSAMPSGPIGSANAMLAARDAAARASTQGDSTDTRTAPPGLTVHGTARPMLRIANSVQHMSPPHAPRSADIDGDGSVDEHDRDLILRHWHTARTDCDLNRDGIVDGADLGVVLAAWSRMD